MAKNIEIQGYAKSLYFESTLKDSVIYYTGILILESLDNFISEKFSLLTPEIISHLNYQINLILPDFFDENFWIDSSKFILGWLESWDSNQKVTKKIFEEFTVSLDNHSSWLKQMEIENLEYVENFLVSLFAYNSAIKITDKLGIANITLEDLKVILGINIDNTPVPNDLIKSNDLSQSFSFAQESINSLTATLIISNVKARNNQRKKRKKPIIQNRFKHLPEEIANFKLQCTKCNSHFAPDWFKSLSEPLIPIKPNDGIGRWIMSKTYETCPFCEEIIPLHMPIEQMSNRVMLFGDEAFREHEGKIICTYSLVGSDFKVISKIEESIRNFKSDLCSSRSPDTWSLHITELYSGQQHKKHPVFFDWDMYKVQETLNRLFNLMQGHSEYLFVYNIALTVKGSLKGFDAHSLLEKTKSDAYLYLLIYIINSLTARKVQPNFFFDAEKATKAEKAIQGWARDAFFGSQHCLLYGFLSRGIEVPEPIFMTPASQPCLELADFVSFVIARYYLRKWQKRDIEFDPARFGKVTYLGFDSCGDLIFDRRESYPWKLFYGES